MNTLLIIGALFWTFTSSAQDITLELMSSCEANGDRKVFSLYRSPSDHAVGFLYDYHQDQPVEHPVEIRYTNAGARAIVSSKDLPMLILVGTGNSVISWNGRTWHCRSRF